LADCWPKDLTSLSENGSLESTGNVSCGYHRNGQCGNHVSRIWLGPERPRESQDLPSCHARHSRPRGARSRAVATGPRLSQLCQQCATPFSNSSLDYRRNDARTGLETAFGRGRAESLICSPRLRWTSTVSAIENLSLGRELSQSQPCHPSEERM
jgi:hypothetical protein